MRTVLATACLCFTLLAVAFAEDYCPATITVKQAIEHIPAGWTDGQSDSTIQLSGITFYSGPPSEQASLVYDKWTKRNGLAYAVWTFPSGTPDRIWLSCRYANTTVELSKELPKETSECDVTYDPKVEINGLPQVQEIRCK